MKKSTQLKIYIVLISLSFITLLVHYLNLKNDLKECHGGDNFIQGGDIQKGMIIDSLQNRCDSLYDELFIEKVQNGKYELTFDHLKETNPKLGKEMEEWMNHETE
jgi:hypothetical protein